MATLFGDIRLAHDLETGRESGDDLRGVIAKVHQDSVLPETDPKSVRHRFDMDIADVTLLDGGQDEGIYNMDNRLVIGRCEMACGRFLFALFDGALNGFQNGDGGLDFIAEELFEFRKAQEIKGVRKGNDNFFAIGPDRDRVVLFIDFDGRPGKKLSIYFRKFRFDIRESHALAQSVDDLALCEEMMGSQNFAQVPSGILFGPDLAGAIEVLFPDQPQFEQKGVQPEILPVGADCLVDLVVNDIFEVFENLQQGAGGFQLGADSNRVFELFLWQNAFLKEKRDDLTKAWGRLSARRIWRILRSGKTFRIRVHINFSLYANLARWGAGKEENLKTQKFVLFFRAPQNLYRNLLLDIQHFFRFLSVCGEKSQGVPPFLGLGGRLRGRRVGLKMDGSVWRGRNFLSFGRGFLPIFLWLP
jgi:hypothetical protein